MTQTPNHLAWPDWRATVRVAELIKAYATDGDWQTVRELRDDFRDGADLSERRFREMLAFRTCMNGAQIDEEVRGVWEGRW